MRFNTVVTGAEWDIDHWRVSLQDGGSVTATYLFTATGFLSQPKKPDIDGVDTFAGKVIHTADWDASYDLTGRRAAVIGTGATAVQLIPEVAKVVRELTVYQRTPIWVSPKLDFAVPPALQRAFARLPLTQRIARLAGSSVLEAMMVTGVLHYKQAPLMTKLAERWCRAHLYRQVRDPELRRKLTPDYTFGCKRPTFSNNYYRTFTRAHVHLETTPIDRIDQTGIITTDGSHRDIDVLLLATGFDLWEANFPAIPIVGRSGRDLGSWWRENRFQAYEGVTVPKFPNYISLNSPYSYSGLSYFTTIESQMRHIDRLFTAMRRRGATVFEVTEQANSEFLTRMTDKIGDSIFALGQCATANSYYFNPHGEATLLRPSSTINAFREARTFPIDDYAFSSREKQPVAAR